MKKNKHDFKMKLLNIGFVYIFALISVVACGEGFKSAAIQRPNLRSMNQGAPGSFQPVFTGIQKIDMREGSGDLSYQVSFVFNDGSQSIGGITTYHKNGSDYYAGVNVGDRFEYGIDALCIVADCSKIVGTIVKVDKLQMTATQSSFIVDQTQQGFAPTVMKHGTYFETSMDAWNGLWQYSY